ncbi:hypothetical protein B484DRAFT_437327, partial [Ochromonadaceae sp. CCMP2298]
DAEGDHQRSRDQARITREALSRERDINGKTKSCPGCGRGGHTIEDCRIPYHPHYNKSGKPWAQSEHGMRYTAAGVAQLKYGEDEKGNKIAMGEKPANAKPYQANSKAKRAFKKRD